MKSKVFWAILCLAFILRMYKLGEVPLSLNWDETSNAYNAYSILKTGRDEYGNFLPLTNRSFEDYKPPLYMYLNIISVALFDPTPFAARLPSAIFGTLTVFLVYLLTKKLFENYQTKFSIAYLSMLMLAISPWHLQVSRVGFEANIGLFFAVAAFTCFLYFILPSKTHKLPSRLLLVLSAILFGLSFYSYHAQRIFIPLMFFATLFIFRKEIFTIPKKLLAVFIIVATSIVLPLMIFLPPEAVSQRFESITLTSYTEDVQKSVEFINQDKQNKILLTNILHNRRVVIGLRYFKNYLSNFDPNFLFVKGDDNLRHHIENMGMLYFFQLPLVLIALYYLFNERSKGFVFLIVWLLISPIPAAPSNASPHALRSLTMVIPLTIISAYAFFQLFRLVKIKVIFFTFSILIFTFSIFPYLHNYYVHYQRDFASFWQYGYLQAASKTEELRDQYTKINISSDIEQAYVFWLFATKYDPKKYQQEGSNLHFDKYYFKANAPLDTNELYVSSDLDDSFKVIDTIHFPNGEKTIEIGYKR